jgi:hypothetical protein
MPHFKLALTSEEKGNVVSIGAFLLETADQDLDPDDCLQRPHPMQFERKNAINADAPG